MATRYPREEDVVNIAGDSTLGVKRGKLASVLEHADLERKLKEWKRKLQGVQAWNGKKSADAFVTEFELLHSIFEDMTKTLHQNNLLQEAEQRRRVRSVIDFRELHPPTFTGSGGPFKAEKWLEDMKILLDAACVSDAQKVNVVKLQLEDYAFDWWMVEESRLEKPITWHTFSEKFLGMFVSNAVKQDMQLKFLNLEQGNNSVDEYAAEFLRLSRFVPELVARETNRADFFYRKLSFEIWEKLAHCEVGTYDEVLDAARRAELLIARTKEKLLEEMSDKEDPTPSRGMVCSYCNRRGHQKKNCRRANNQCLACGSDDHQVGDCPRRH